MIAVLRSKSIYLSILGVYFLIYQGYKDYQFFGASHLSEFREGPSIRLEDLISRKVASVNYQMGSHTRKLLEELSKYQWIEKKLLFRFDIRKNELIFKGTTSSTTFSGHFFNWDESLEILTILYTQGKQSQFRKLKLFKNVDHIEEVPNREISHVQVDETILYKVWFPVSYSSPLSGNLVEGKLVLSQKSFSLQAIFGERAEISIEMEDVQIEKNYFHKKMDLASGGTTLVNGSIVPYGKGQFMVRLLSGPYRNTRFLFVSESIYDELTAIEEEKEFSNEDTELNQKQSDSLKRRYEHVSKNKEGFRPYYEGYQF